MSEFALLVNSTFREFRYYDEQPEDIPHKGVMWIPVSRVTAYPVDSGSAICSVLSGSTRAATRTLLYGRCPFACSVPEAVL